MAYVQLTLICVASLCLLAPCLSVEQGVANAVGWRTYGAVVGESKARLAMLVKATKMTASTPEQKACVDMKVGLAFQDVKNKLQEATLQWTAANSQQQDVELMQQSAHELLTSVAYKVVRDYEQDFKKCLA